jgi:hypothetical protein
MKEEEEEEEVTRCEKCGWWIINGWHWSERVEAD